VRTEEKLKPFIKSHTGYWRKVEEPNFSSKKWEGELRMHPENTQSYRDEKRSHQRRLHGDMKAKDLLEQMRVDLSSTISM
jgi:hypothetical protein